MKFWLILSQIFLVLGFLTLSVSPSLDEASLLQDNEFAEFEQFDSDDDSQEIGVGSQPPLQYISVDESEDDILVEVSRLYFIIISSVKYLYTYVLLISG